MLLYIDDLLCLHLYDAELVYKDLIILDINDWSILSVKRFPCQQDFNYTHFIDKQRIANGFSIQKTLYLVK